MDSGRETGDAQVVYVPAKKMHQQVVYRLRCTRSGWTLLHVSDVITGQENAPLGNYVKVNFLTIIKSSVHGTADLNGVKLIGLLLEAASPKRRLRRR